MKRGFTLVELLATLIVLSVVAIIVVPNIKQNVKEAREGLYATQLQTFKSEAQNWAANNIDKIPTKDNEDLKIGGYIDEDFYQDTDGKKFNDNIFVLITCTVVEENENNNSNYKYSYEVYDTNEKHLSYLAKIYAQKNNVTSKTTVTLSNLITLANSNLIVWSKLKNIEDGSLISSANVIIDYSNNEYSFKVNIG